MTEANTKRTLIEILKVINDSETPVGARLIADSLEGRGYSIGERGVRYHLRMLDASGFTKRMGYSGRTITKKGINEINNALVGDRMGFVISRIHELIYKTTFNPQTKKGDIIVNISIIDKDDFEKSTDLIRTVIGRGYAVSPKHHIFDEREKISNIIVPSGSLAIASICSITIDGVLLKNGVPVETRYGGIVQIKDGRPERFTDIISYTGTSLDPIKIFLSRNMSSVTDILERNSGYLLANLREAPIIAHEKIIELLQHLKGSDIGGVIEHIHAGDTVLSAPISLGRIGIPVYAGVNPLAAVMNTGVEVTTYPVSTVMDYRDMDTVF